MYLGGSRPTERPDKNKPGTSPKIEEGHVSKDLPATMSKLHNQDRKLTSDVQPAPTPIYRRESVTSI